MRVLFLFCCYFNKKIDVIDVIVAFRTVRTTSFAGLTYLLYVTIADL